MAENAILEELRRDFAGLAFLPRAWLVRLTEKESRQGGHSPVGFPDNPRKLDEYLRKLEERKQIVRLRAQDGGSAFGLHGTWDTLSPADQGFLKRTPFAVRGSPKGCSLLLSGPGILKAELRAKVWSPVESPTEPGKTLYRCTPLMNLRHQETGELVPETSLIVEEETRFLHLVIGEERPRRGKIKVEVIDDSGAVLETGFLRAWRKDGVPSPDSV